MRSSDASRNSSDGNPKRPVRKAATKVPGQLSRTEDFLYTGARGIDKLIDQVLDRPMSTLAIAAGALALVALFPRG